MCVCVCESGKGYIKEQLEKEASGIRKHCVWLYVQVVSSLIITTGATQLFITFQEEEEKIGRSWGLDRHLAAQGSKNKKKGNGTRHHDHHTLTSAFDSALSRRLSRKRHDFSGQRPLEVPKRMA